MLPYRLASSIILDVTWRKTKLYVRPKLLACCGRIIFWHEWKKILVDPYWFLTSKTIDYRQLSFYKFRIAFWMIFYNFVLLTYCSLQFLKRDFISLQIQSFYNFWKLFSLSLQFLKLAFISLQFLKLAFISLWFIYLYDSDATPHNKPDARTIDDR